MPAQRLWIALAAFGLTATACGPGDGADGTTALAPSGNNAVADSDASAADDSTEDESTADDSSADEGSAPASDTDETDETDETAADTSSSETDETAADEPAPEPVSVEQAAANAEATIDSLAGNDDVRLIEVLDVSTGTATTLAQAVDGDRPVLVWFWAPH